MTVQEWRHNTVEEATRLGNLLALMEIAGSPKAKELRHKIQPTLDVAQLLATEELARAYRLAACAMALDDRSIGSGALLTKQVRQLLGAECWDENQRVSAAITWAIDCIDRGNLLDRESSDLVAIFGEYSTEAAIQFGLELTKLLGMKHKIAESSR